MQYQENTLYNIICDINIFNAKFIAYGGIFSNHLAMDDFDIAYAKEVQSYIQKYTERTGNEIRYLAIGRDSDPTWSYNGIKYVSYDMNGRISYEVGRILD